MDVTALLGLLSAFGVVIPPPWGPIIAVAARVIPLVATGKNAIDAIQAIDPNLMAHLNAAASEVGLTPDAIAKAIFAPHQMTREEENAWMDRASGGPRGGLT